MAVLNANSLPIMAPSTQDPAQSADVEGSSPAGLIESQSSRTVELKRWVVRGAIALFLSLLWIALSAQPTA